MTPPKFIPSLTPLRGIAALLVVFLHYDIVGQLFPEGIFIVKKFYLMVDLFFILSGFIMYHVYSEYFVDHIKGKDFWKFMKARFARIYPLHIFTLLLAGGFALNMWSKVPYEETGGFMQAAFDPMAFVLNIILIDAWGMYPFATWNVPSWSISIEFFLYLLFPFLLWFMVKQRKIATWLYPLVIIGGTLSVMYFFEPLYQLGLDELFGRPADAIRPRNTIDVITGSALIRGLCGFLLGMILYEAYLKEWMKSRLSHGIIFPAIWIFLIVMWIGDWLPDIFTLGLFAILILNTIYNEGVLYKILNSKPLTYLGDISYSVYMMHFVFLIALFTIGTASQAGNRGSEGDAENGAKVEQLAQDSLSQEIDSLALEADTLIALGDTAAIAEVDTEEGEQNNRGEVNYLYSWLGLLLALAIVIGVASLTYRFIEKPARRYLRDKL